MRLGMSVTFPALLVAASLAACTESDEPVNDAINPDLNTDVSAPLAEGENSFTEDQARGHVENAGYDDVSAMTLNDNGLWQGTATQDGQTVNVAVDYRGIVTTTPGVAPPPNAAGANAETASTTRTDQDSTAATTMSQDPAAAPGATSPEMRRTGDRG